MDDPATLDATGLKALAHPLRITILERLRVDGPATASSLARELGESSGATSYHLRALARAGLVVEDHRRGTGRERWWQPAAHRVDIRHDAADDDVEASAARDWIVDEVTRRRIAWIERWQRDRDELAPAWRDASVAADAFLRLRPQELQALAEELFAVVERYRARPTSDGELVRLILHALPQPAEREVTDDAAS